MDADDDWNKLLNDHPIFRFPKSITGASQDTLKSQLELSTTTLPKFTEFDSQNDDPTPSGRRQTMALKDADLIVAVSKELRITCLGDMKLGRSTRKSYKVCYLIDSKYGTVLFNRRRCCTPRIWTSTFTK
jgi:nucleoporin NUP82